MHTIDHADQLKVKQIIRHLLLKSPSIIVNPHYWLIHTIDHADHFVNEVITLPLPTVLRLV